MIFRRERDNSRASRGVGADSALTLDANHVITITHTPHTSLTAADFHLV